MKPVLITVSMLALAAVLLLPVLFFTDAIDLAQTQRLLLVATLAWLVITPLWMGRTRASGDEPTS